jgi:hypothetical protein
VVASPGDRALLPNLAPTAARFCEFAAVLIREAHYLLFNCFTTALYLSARSLNFWTA